MRMTHAGMYSPYGEPMHPEDAVAGQIDRSASASSNDGSFHLRLSSTARPTIQEQEVCSGEPRTTLLIAATIGATVRPKPRPAEMPLALPTELWERVIDHNWGYPATLVNCSQVCRAWTARSRFHLLSSVSPVVTDVIADLAADAATSVTDWSQ